MSAAVALRALEWWRRWRGLRRLRRQTRERARTLVTDALDEDGRIRVEFTINLKGDES